jgi:hypothetical protein
VDRRPAAGTTVAVEVGEVERLEEQARKLERVIRRTKDAALLDDDSTDDDSTESLN